jgi:hypothetical protein
VKTVSRLLVLAALLLGIVLMHHVAGAGHADGHSPAHETTGRPMPGRPPTPRGTTASRRRRRDMGWRTCAWRC